MSTLDFNTTISDYYQQMSQMQEREQQQLQKIIQSLKDNREEAVGSQKEHFDLLTKLTQQLADSYFHTARQLTQLDTLNQEGKMEEIKSMIDVNFFVKEKQFDLMQKEMQMIQEENGKLRSENKDLRSEIRDIRQEKDINILKKDSQPRLGSIETSKVSSYVPEMGFGRVKWEKYFGELKEEPPLSKNIDEILESDCPIWPGKKVEDTWLLCLIPATVNKVPFNIARLDNLVKFPLQGYKTNVFQNKGVADMYWNIPVKESYWILMTKDIIPGSSGTPLFDPRSPMSIVRELAATKHKPFRLPKLIEATTVISTEFVRTGNRIYMGDNTYTGCQETKNLSICVGAHSQRGLEITARDGFFTYRGAGCVWQL